MCVQLEDYSQVRGNVQTYASGDVKIWIGTSYTTYGLYEVIPVVGLPGPASPPTPTPALINLDLKWGHSPSAVQAVGQSPSRPPWEEMVKEEAGVYPQRAQRLSSRLEGARPGRAEALGSPNLRLSPGSTLN